MDHKKTDDFANINFNKLELHDRVSCYKLRRKSFTFSTLLKSLVILAKQNNLTYREENIERNLNLVLKYFELNNMQRKLLSLIYIRKQIY